MGGPWEDYAQPTAEPDGPWKAYQSQQPAAPINSDLDVAQAALGVPEAFLDRVRAGQALTRITMAAGKSASEGAGTGTPTGFEDETLNHLIDLGVFHDPLKSKPGPLQMVNEAVLMPPAQVWQAITRAVSGGIHGAGGAFGQIVEEFGGSQGQGNRAKNEIINLGNWAMIEGGMGRFSRPAVEPGGVAHQTVGGLPVAEDFANAAKVLSPAETAPKIKVVNAGADKYNILDSEGKVLASADIGIVNIDGKRLAQIDDINTPALEGVTTQAEHDAAVKASRNALGTGQMREAMRQFLELHPDVEGFTGNRVSGARNRGEMGAGNIQNITVNLTRMWREDGIHPAEAVHDAANDAFLKNEITARRVEVPLDPADAEVLTETGGRPGALSAAASDPPNIPIDIQPAQPPGSLAASFKAAGDTLLDIGRDAQMLVAPMARGTNDSMAIAKDFANSLRRNRWDWTRIDEDVAKKFTPEQRARMWTAADEESVSIQLGEPAAMREHQGLATLEPAERAAVVELQARAQNAWVRARDLGMVEGEGLPAYTPRMLINVAGGSSKEAALALDGIGSNLRTKTANMLKRKYLEAQDTEAAAKAKYGDQAALARDIRVLPLATSQMEDAIAGRTLINNIKDYGTRTGAETVVEGAIPAGSDTKWFTLDHPAFRSWRPKLGEVDGRFQALKDAEGNTIFEQVPIYVHGDFEGPLRAVLSQKSGAAYGAMMALKGKTMSMIMNSPLIHNAVEWGRALPAMPGKVATFKVYFEGNRAKNNVAVMQEAIDNGLVPIGHRFFNQDISGLMESPDLTPGRSWTAKLLAAVPGLFDEAAGTAVKTAIDKAGNFWHNRLLWDRVADLQMGLYVNMRADAIAKGIDAQTASRMAAHWANRYAGALPKEAMSDAATKVSNMLMFSRSFTMGNLGVLKDMFTGLPKDVIAQIERDAGFRAGSIEAGIEAGKEAVAEAKHIARRKAMGVVVADMAMLYIGNSLLQNAINILFNDSTLDKEMHGYAERFLAKLQAVKEHPLELIQPLRLLGDLSSTSENEPGKQERIRVGQAANGTAIYMRQPAGKIGEEFIGYMTGPLDMMRKKLGTVARPAWQIASNDAGFGRKVYDPDADTPGKYIKNLALIAAHLAKSQFPEGQISAFSDLVKGEGDAKVNALQALGPFGGVTFSKGAPGGPAVGEMYASRAQHEFQVNQALPDIRRQIQRGDVDGAINRMTELDIPQGLQRFYIRTTLNPATRMSPRAVRDFYLHATPEQRLRFDRAQQAPPQP
jgi:hypothetical protein